MPFISGTMLIYTERCSVTPEGGFFFFFIKEKVPKIKDNIQKSEDYEKVPYGCLCVSQKPLFHNLT